MEAIMTCLIQEGDNFPLDLVKPLFNAVNNENQGIPVATRRLAIQVLKNCSDKVKPYLIEQVEQARKTYDAFNNILASIQPESPAEENVMIEGENDDAPCHETVLETVYKSTPRDICKSPSIKASMKLMLIKHASRPLINHEDIEMLQTNDALRSEDGSSAEAFGAVVAGGNENSSNALQYEDDDSLEIVGEEQVQPDNFQGCLTFGPQMSFTETVRLKLYWNTTYTTEPDGTITVQWDAPDGYLIIDRMLDFSELVDKVLSVIGVDREGLYIDFSLVWTERSGKSDDEYVPSDEDSDDDTDFESSSSVPYVFDDISGWDKTLEEVENDGIKMWDGNPLTLGLDIHFANKPEAQAAMGEWNLVHGRTFRREFRCEKATDTWKMVVWSDSHNCLGANKRNESRNVTSSMIARLVAQNVRKHPDFAVAQIQIEVMKRYQVECSYKKAWHGRRKALEALYDCSPPTPMKLYEEARKKSLRQKVNRFSKRNQKYEVVTIAPDNQPWKADEKQVVLYANRECTCGRWQTFRFPCSHALRVARELGDDPFPLFDPCYTTHQWYQQFSENSTQSWNHGQRQRGGSCRDDTKLVHHAGRGRKRVNRKKLWAWERILTVQPKILGRDLDLSDCPLGTRWSREKKVQGITRFNLAAYRDQLAVLAESDATLMEDVRSPSIIGQRTFDADSFGYDRLGEIAQLLERALSVNATNVVRHDLDRHVEVSAWAWGQRQSQHLSHISPPKMSGLIFPSPAVHPIGLHIDLHSILDKIQPIGLTSFIPSVSTSFFADPSCVLPSDYVSQRPSNQFFLHSFSSLGLLVVVWRFFY
ncbi:OLC1v1005617C1 [Oldenlandia corymbosa var. corymbosa]|nr:OLC1v1005617C1 [Oldenlandia corymbosa var. corymbosa]